jgi:hypothetical protein
MPTIRIDDEVYKWLKSQAEPFEDTPNSVLRRLAGLDRLNAITDIKSIKDNNKNEKGVLGKMNTSPSYTIMPKHPAKYLARNWKINVVHVLYDKNGKWYHHLADFPGALLDPNGYILFNSELEYKNSSYLQQGIELHVPNGISSIPGYKRMS